MDRHSRSNILYRRALVDLAVCYAGEGYGQEAARLMNRSLGLPPETDNIEILADCCICCSQKKLEGTSTFMTCFTFFGNGQTGGLADELSFTDVETKRLPGEGGTPLLDEVNLYMTARIVTHRLQDRRMDTSKEERAQSQFLKDCSSCVCVIPLGVYRFRPFLEWYPVKGT